MNAGSMRWRTELTSASRLRVRMLSTMNKAGDPSRGPSRSRCAPRWAAARKSLKIGCRYCWANRERLVPIAEVHAKDQLEHQPQPKDGYGPDDDAKDARADNRSRCGACGLRWRRVDTPMSMQMVKEASASSRVAGNLSLRSSCHGPAPRGRHRLAQIKPQAARPDS